MQNNVGFAAQRSGDRSKGADRRCKDSEREQKMMASKTEMELTSQKKQQSSIMTSVWRHLLEDDNRRYVIGYAPIRRTSIGGHSGSHSPAVGASSSPAYRFPAVSAGTCYYFHLIQYITSHKTWQENIIKLLLPCERLIGSLAPLRNS